MDWDYNREDKTNIFRPWGFQTGHLTEWAKLLLQLERHRPGEWMLPTARHFFDTAMQRGWDATHGGLVYGFAPEGPVCDGDKYFWVQAESFAAAALLAVRTGDAAYWQCYERIWAYAWAHFVDHTHGAWYRILTPTTASSATRKARPARRTTTPWVRATTCCARWARDLLHAARHSRHRRSHSPGYQRKYH